jgi:F1F0 ATPase subunit 2
MASVGAVLGTFFYGGLWLTLKRLNNTSRPVLLLLGSYLARMALCLPIFYLAVRGSHWQRLLILTAAFLTVRMILVHRLGPRGREARLSLIEEQ